MPDQRQTPRLGFEAGRGTMWRGCGCGSDFLVFTPNNGCLLFVSQSCASFGQPASTPNNTPANNRLRRRSHHLRPTVASRQAVKCAGSLIRASLAGATVVSLCAMYTLAGPTDQLSEVRGTGLTCHAFSRHAPRIRIVLFAAAP